MPDMYSPPWEKERGLSLIWDCMHDTRKPLCTYIHRNKHSAFTAKTWYQLCMGIWYCTSEKENTNLQPGWWLICLRLSFVISPTLVVGLYLLVGGNIFWNISGGIFSFLVLFYSFFLLLRGARGRWSLSNCRCYFGHFNLCGKWKHSSITTKQELKRAN